MQSDVTKPYIAVVSKSENKIVVKECCMLCKHGLITSATIVFCRRTENNFDYLAHCKHFEMRPELTPIVDVVE